MKTILSLFVLCMAFSASTFSQSISENGCGTPPSEAQLDRISDFISKGMPKAKGTAGMDSIPVTIHIVGKTNGTGYYELERLFPMLCKTNADFAPTNFYFYVVWPIHYINNDNYYEHDFFDGQQMMAANNDANTVNIYFVQDPAGNCGYYSPAMDAVAIGKNCAAPNSTTLTHELGHFFDLPHTFSGWENGNTPATPENVARTGPNANCNTRGDRFCDTDADYVGNRWNCPYSGAPLTDPLGVPFRPDSSLYMSYTDDACMSRFSPQQMAVMQNNLASRPNLLNFSYPSFAALDTPNVAYPVPLMYSNDRTIRWNPVPGAQYYLVQLATQSVPSLYRERWLTASTSVQVTSQLFDNVNFYAYITPLNGKNLCTPKTRRQLFTFTNALGVNDVLSNANVEVVPNPAASSTELRVDDNFKGNYTVYLMNMAGQIVNQQQVNFSSSNKVATIATSELSNGIYTIRVAGDKGSIVKKLVVQH